MTPEELLEEWESGSSTGMRPARIQTVRDDLREVTGVPVPRRITEIESWLDRMKATVTTKLREAVDED